MTTRDRFARIIADAGITQATAARMLSEATGDPVPLRTVQAWLQADGPSSRPCPGWAVYVLGTELAGYSRATSVVITLPEADARHFRALLSRQPFSFREDADNGMHTFTVTTP